MGRSTNESVKHHRAPEGVKAVKTRFPATQIFVCCIDKELNDRKFIVPGLGDAGDRIFNTLDSQEGTSVE